MGAICTTGEEKRWRVCVCKFAAVTEPNLPASGAQEALRPKGRDEAKRVSGVSATLERAKVKRIAFERGN